jgi:hypothetical protein
MNLNVNTVAQLYGTRLQHTVRLRYSHDILYKTDANGVKKLKPVLCFSCDRVPLK